MNLPVIRARHQRDALGIDLDHRAMLIAAHRHERVGDTAGKRIRTAIHQLGQHIGDVLRIARRYRHMVDHLVASSVGPKDTRDLLKIAGDGQCQ
jgi:hypothetical protein